MPKVKDNYVIPEIQIVSGGTSLPPEVINHPTNEKRCFTFSFEQYIEKKCEIEHLEKASFKKALIWFKEVGKMSSADEIRIRGRGNKIKNTGTYSILFSGLPEDVDIWEYKLSGANRVFYYIDDGKKIVYCRLIKNTHFEY